MADTTTPDEALARQVEEELKKQATAASPKAASPKASSPKRASKNKTPPTASSDDQTQQPTSPGTAAKKRKTENEDDGLNKTSNTQADPSLPGIPASKVTSLGNYIRMSDEKKKQEDSSILKPKNLTLSEWESIPVSTRVLFVIYHRNLAEFKLTNSDLSFDQFLASVEEIKSKFSAFVREKNEKVEKQVASNQKKISGKAKNADRDIRLLFQERSSIKGATAAAVAATSPSATTASTVAAPVPPPTPNNSPVSSIRRARGKKPAPVAGDLQDGTHSSQ